jgi:hypothetical protein
VRGRKKELHRPKRVTIIIEHADLETARASHLNHSVIYRAGLKICARTRPEVLQRLALDEIKMAEEHEAEAEMHRHKAKELQGRIRTGQITQAEPGEVTP